MTRAILVGMSLAILGVVLVGMPIGILYIYWAMQMGPRPPEYLGIAAPVIALVATPLLWFKGSVAHRRVLVFITLGFGAASWSVIAYGGWQWSRFGDQARNLESMRECGRSIEEFKDRTGAYPGNLADVSLPAKDQWGRDLYYERTGDGFVLVSYGRGGVPDGLDYWAARQEYAESGRIVDTCGDWSADQILMELGFVRVCGK